MRDGERCTAVDGKSAEDVRKLDDAVTRMKGPVGTKITIEVLRAGSSEPIEFEIVRELIHIKTVVGDRRGPT